jgi:hypothetical protein
VLSPIQRYSSVRSAGIPYTSILWVEVTFLRQDKPKTPRAFVLCLKYELWASTAFVIRRKKRRLILNLFQN